MIETTKASASESSPVRLERAGPIATLVLANPARRNALSLAVMEELRTAFEALGADRGVRVAILRAEGPAFSAGHDLREVRCVGAEGDLAQARTIFEACVRLMETIQRIPQPVIAEVAGIATAAGCQLVAGCDLAIAAGDARFATPGVKIGLFCTTPMVALTRAVGRKRAMEMLLTGEFIDAETAAAWGLVNRVVPPERLHDEVLALARKIAEASARVVELGKAAFYRQIELEQHQAYAYAQEIMSANALAADAAEGISAFLERRSPDWPT
ncbi:MAG: enoyl-CoA hydratase [Vulcanimicrobiaceae bacterium]